MRQCAGSAAAASSNRYTYTDKEAGKSGPYYYRLKIVDKDGSFTYSSLRSVIFGETQSWMVYPNPSTGNFHLVYQLNSGQELHVNIIDAKGSLVKEYHTISNGFLQKLNMDLSGKQFANGVYLLETNVSGQLQTFRIYKQK